MASPTWGSPQEPQGVGRPCRSLVRTQGGSTGQMSATQYYHMPLIYSIHLLFIYQSVFKSTVSVSLES